MTDENVLRTLMRHRRLTRAELAAATGISKPTVGESVRRLGEAGLVVDTGERTAGGRGRGRVGTYYALAADIGTALAVSVAPEGVVAERIDAHGEVVARAEEAVARPARPEDVAAALRDAATGTGGPLPRLAVVSAADPVDRASGRMIHLPDSPFLLGELDPHDVLAPFVTGPIIVDNDVNWAARAEREDARDFAYLFLGEGLGGAIVSDGEVRQGAGGLAGEIAHLITVGPHGRATRLIDVFDDLGLRQADSTAIDVDRLLAAIAAPAAADAQRVREALGEAVGGVVAAIVALTDPAYVVIGGPWGTHPAILAAITSATTAQPRHVPIRAARRTDEPSLTGARLDALDRLRAAIVQT
ncbi:ROK family transcriptional regulator [Cryptosporangium sp. NPDC051539]|uniref:ROK family transcriptional regulator n=1 Tax=Cryptosporangium sp. NPDC051539 TaxID=3363962 RepID=UPI0037BC3F45